MRLFFLLISFITLSHSFAQDSTKYRFSFGVSSLSIMNYGLRDLENVPSPYYPEYYKVYQNESYTLDYQNFSFSKGINYNASAMVLNTPKFYLKIGANVFFEKYNEELTYTLTDIGDGSLIDYGIYTNPYTPDDIPLGYSESITFSEDNMKTGGVMLEGIIFCKVKNNWNIGGGVFYVDRFRYEWFKFNSGLKPNYSPFVSPRGRNSYRTKQIGVSMEVNKTWKRLNIFLNLSQTAITTKKSENKGGYEFKYEQSMVPLSQNLDFRYPLIIKVGLSIGVRKIK